jgi:ubiquinone/menaquinone biosynthesis C-methylase UbiE
VIYVVKEVERLLQRFDGGRVLDVATQHGRFVEVLIDNLKSYAAIVGIDLERRFIQTARDSISGANVSFQVMDAEDLEFEDESFDTVTISASLHHMGDAERVLSEMKRVLKPGGRLLVVEMHGDAETEPERTSARIHEWAAEIDRALGRLHNGVFSFDVIFSLF